MSSAIWPAACIVLAILIAVAVEHTKHRSHYG